MTTKLDKKSSSVDVQSRKNRQPQVQRCETVTKTPSGRVSKPSGVRKSVRLELKRMSTKEVEQAVLATAAGKQVKSLNKTKLDLKRKALSPQIKTTQTLRQETIYEGVKESEESIVMIEGEDEEDVDADVMPVPSTARQKAERHNARVKQLRIMRMKDIAESRETRLLRRRGLYVQKPTLGTKHVMWADKSELVRVYRYSPTIT